MAQVKALGLEIEKGEGRAADLEQAKDERSATVKG